MYDSFDGPKVYKYINNNELNKIKIVLLGIFLFKTEHFSSFGVIITPKNNSSVAISYDNHAGVNGEM